MKKTRKILALGLSFVMMLGLCLTAGTVNATGDITAVEVSTAEQFKEEYYDKGTRNFIVTAPLEFHEEEHFAGVEITADENVTGNLLTFFKSGSSLTNAQITTAANTKYAIHIYECGMTINNLTVNHSLNNGGAPVLVNGKNSSATFTGNLNMTLGPTSWYGVNVEKGTADFTKANIICHTNEANKTQSLVCLENTTTVNGLSQYSEVVTGFDDQIAYVQADDLAAFITAKQNEKKEITSVIVSEKIILNETLYLYDDMYIRCDNDGAFIAGNSLNDNVITVMPDANVKLEDVIIETRVASSKSGLHIYGGTVEAIDLTIINENTGKDGKGGGAAVVLNSGNLTLKGKTTFQLGKDSWGGINIDNNITGKTPKMTIIDNATIDVMSPEDSVKLYYVDTDEQDDIPLDGDKSVVTLPDTVTVTINKKEVTVDNGVITEPTDPTTPGKPEQPVDPEKEMITITLKAIVDGKEINLEELGLKPEQYILPVEKGVAFTADELKVLDDMKESLSVEGYTFKGYFLDDKGTEALKADVPFNADATIYMIWDKEVDVTVTPNPGDTEKPNTDNTNKPEQKPTTTDKTVKTDDSSNAALYGLMISLSVVGAGIVVLAKKREELLNK